MKLVIELPPEASRSPNKTMGRSFWVYANHKKKCEEMLFEWDTNGGCNTAWLLNMKSRRPQTHVHIDGYGCRPKDCDNLTAGCKAIIDVLRQNGYLVDDNPQMMTLSVASHKVKHRKDEKLVLTLTCD